MKQWTMPRVAVEAFAANEYVSSCENTQTYMKVYAPIQEDNSIPGWQQHNAPAGNHIDSNGKNSDSHLILHDYDYRIVRVDDYDTDDTNTYYMITLHESITSDSGRVYPSGSILYKYYSPGAFTEYIKNFS